MDPALYREMADIQQTHWWFAARRHVLSGLIGALTPTPSRILEIGCGTGGNLAMLARFGQVCAAEMDEFARDMARQTAPDIDIQPGWLPDGLPFEKQEFDLICLFDVLEHVRDDQAALASVFQKVRPGGGKVLLTVPAYQWLYTAHDAAHHHLRRYTARQVSALAENVGFRVRRKGYFNTILFPLIVFLRLLGRLTGKETGSDAAMPPPFLNRTLYWLFASEALLLPKFFFPFGVSSILILERP